jgi:hypothetical protein
MTRARSWAWPIALCLSATTFAVLTRSAGAQQPVPAKYRDEAARVNGVTLPDASTPPVALPVDPAADAARRAQRRAADSIAATTPVSTPLMEGAATIARGTFESRGFDVPPNAHCTLTGTLESDGRDFEALVFPAPEMPGWRVDAHAGKAVWQSGPTHAATLTVPLPGPGTYDLVISNRAAWFLSRTVKSKVQLVCTRDWQMS